MNQCRHGRRRRRRHCLLNTHHPRLSFSRCSPPDKTMVHRDATNSLRRREANGRWRPIVDRTPTVVLHRRLPRLRHATADRCRTTVAHRPLHRVHRVRTPVLVTTTHSNGHRIPGVVRPPLQVVLVDLGDSHRLHRHRAPMEAARLLLLPQPLIRTVELPSHPPVEEEALLNPMGRTRRISFWSCVLPVA